MSSTGNVWDLGFQCIPLFPLYETRDCRKQQMHNTLIQILNIEEFKKLKRIFSPEQYEAHKRAARAYLKTERGKANHARVQSKYNQTIQGKTARSQGLARFHRKRRAELVGRLGGKCARCSFSDYRALQFDHINGGGAEDIRRLGAGYGMVNYYLKNPSLAKQKLQILCANCNWIKRAELQEHRKRIYSILNGS